MALNGSLKNDAVSALNIDGLDIIVPFDSEDVALDLYTRQDNVSERIDS